MSPARRIGALFEPPLSCLLVLLFFAAGAVVLLWPSRASCRIVVVLAIAITSVCWMFRI